MRCSEKLFLQIQHLIYVNGILLALLKKFFYGKFPNRGEGDRYIYLKKTQQILKKFEEE